MFVIKALEGKVHVKPINEMTQAEICNEIESYSSEDLLNSVTLDRLGELRLSAPTYAQACRDAKVAVRYRLMERMKKRVQLKMQPSL